MATQRNKQQWLELLVQQQHSGLSVAAFCRQQDINAKNFYYHIKRQRSASADEAPSAFVRAELDGGPDTRQNPSNIRLQRGRCQLELPRDMSPLWIAELVVALS